MKLTSNTLDEDMGCHLTQSPTEKAFLKKLYWIAHKRVDQLLTQEGNPDKLDDAAQIGFPAMGLLHTLRKVLGDRGYVFLPENAICPMPRPGELKYHSLLGQQVVYNPPGPYKGLSSEEQMECDMEKRKVLWNLSAKESQELRQLHRAWVDTRALPVKLAHIRKLLMDAQQIPIQERPIYLITANGSHFLELPYNFLEGQGFVDATKADPGDDQGYFLCLLRGQNGKTRKKVIQRLHLANALSSQSQPICILVGIGVVKGPLNL